MNTIRFGFGDLSVGRVLVACTDKGLCALRLVNGTRPTQLVQELQREFPDARLVDDSRGVAPYVRQAEQVLSGKLSSSKVKLDPQGTSFQKRVWQALVDMPWGTTCSYSDLAKKAGKPKAIRAAASACARNPIALIVPCHRVLRNDGSLGGYGYGLAMKRELLARERII